MTLSGQTIQALRIALFLKSVEIRGKVDSYINWAIFEAYNDFLLLMDHKSNY